MPAYSLGERTPRFASANVFIAPTASLIGDARVGNHVSIWFSAVVRADNEIIELGDEVNIQDGAVIHADPGFPCRLARGVSVGHCAMVHGATVGENTLIAINAVVLNGCVIGRNCIIGANALIPEGKEIPDNSLVMGSPGKVVKEISEMQAMRIQLGALHYVENFKRYREHLKKHVAL